MGRFRARRAQGRGEARLSETARHSSGSVRGPGAATWPPAPLTEGGGLGRGSGATSSERGSARHRSGQPAGRRRPNTRAKKRKRKKRGRGLARTVYRAAGPGLGAGHQRLSRSWRGNDPAEKSRSYPRTDGTRHSTARRFGTRRSVQHGAIIKFIDFARRSASNARSKPPRKVHGDVLPGDRAESRRILTKRTGSDRSANPWWSPAPILRPRRPPGRHSSRVNNEQGRPIGGGGSQPLASTLICSARPPASGFRGDRGVRRGRSVHGSDPPINRTWPAPPCPGRGPADGP